MTTKVTPDMRTYNSGQVIQSVYAESATRVASNSAIPTDNTKPQSGEGTELITASITPKYSTSKLRVRFTGYFTNLQGGAGLLVVSMFRDAGADAIAAALQYSATDGGTFSFDLARVVDASSVAATTFKIRFGPNGAAGSGFAASGGAANNYFGGADYYTLTVEELAA